MLFRSHGHADNTKTTGRDCIGSFEMDAVSQKPKLKFVMATANDMLRQAGYQPGAVAATWAARGWLVHDKSSSTTKVVSLNGIKVRMYELSATALALHVWPSDLEVNALLEPDLPF